MKIPQASLSSRYRLFVQRLSGFEHNTIFCSRAHTDCWMLSPLVKTRSTDPQQQHWLADLQPATHRPRTDTLNAWQRNEPQRSIYGYQSKEGHGEHLDAGTVKSTETNTRRKKTTYKEQKKGITKCAKLRQSPLPYSQVASDTANLPPFRRS